MGGPLGGPVPVDRVSRVSRVDIRDRGRRTEADGGRRRYVEWTDAVRATLGRRAPGLRNDAGTRNVRGSGDSGSAAASASSTTTRPRVVVVPTRRGSRATSADAAGACNRELGAADARLAGRCALRDVRTRAMRRGPGVAPRARRGRVQVEVRGECDLTAAKCRCGRGVAHLDAGDLRNAHPDWKLPNDVAAKAPRTPGRTPRRTPDEQIP